MPNNKQEQQFHSPLRTLLGLIIVGALSLFTSAFWPEDQLTINEDLSLKFASLDSYSVLKSEPEGIQSAEEFLKGYDGILMEDSVKSTPVEIELTVDSAAIKAEEERLRLERLALLAIQTGPLGIENMDAFFDACDSLKTSSGKVQVMHYGDSQIEGDRITRYFRNELQKRFGGEGPGLVPPVEVVPSSSIKQSVEGDWNRYTIYGKKDTTVKHSRYGFMGTFASYDSTGGSLFFQPSNIAFTKSRKFSEVKLYYGSFGDSCSVSLLNGDSLISKRSLRDSAGFGTLKWSLPSNATALELKFENGPIECYGVALEGRTGIQVSNIPMRGSSGTIFKRIDRTQMRQQLKTVDPKLVLLQYGGNTVPYVTDSTKAENYGKWVTSQIKYLKGILPETAFILIGPSDMAHKENEYFVTYPYLEPVRNALKKAAFETGCGFWDIYEVMGGKNSMKAWVDAEPALAGSDYVHFTPKGARKIGELFTKAFFDLKD